MIRKTPSGLLSVAALVVALAASAKAAEPRGGTMELAAVETDLGQNISALTYWIEEADGVHAVTTIDTVLGGETTPEAARHAIVRFAALIPSGQSQIISVPGPIGSEPVTLRIRNLGRRANAADIEIDRVAPAADRTRVIN